MPSAENVTISLSRGTLRLWNLSVSPDMVNGSRLYLTVAPSSSGNVLVLPNGESANVSSSLTMTFEREGRGFKAFLGNASLFSVQGEVAFSPQIRVQAEKGASVLLRVNYVSASSTTFMLS